MGKTSPILKITNYVQGKLQVLVNNAIAVNLTPQSDRQQTSEKNILERVKNGDYWVIVTNN